jgi:hypothetical protein
MIWVTFLLCFFLLPLQLRCQFRNSNLRLNEPADNWAEELSLNNFTGGVALMGRFMGVSLEN